MAIKRPCLGCGTPTTRTTRCGPCARRKQRQRDAKRGTPAQRGYNHTYLKHRKLILAGGPACLYCGRPASTADHVIALADGGDNSIDNLVGRCCRPRSPTCRGTRDAWRWLTEEPK